MIYDFPFEGTLPKNCHSEAQRAEESGEGLVRIRVDPPPQTLRYAQGDMVRETFKARPIMGEG